VLDLNWEGGRGNRSFPVAEHTNRWVRGSSDIRSERRENPTPGTQKILAIRQLAENFRFLCVLSLPKGTN